MREIEFRGKRVDNGEWAYGYYCKATRHWHKYGIHNDWIITSAFQNGGFFNVMERYAVISETVGMWTGLTDKNGKKIFEGDRIFWNSQYGVVKFGDYETSDGHKKLGFYIDWDFLCWISESIVIATKHEPCEVIGNIHEEAQNARNI